MDERIFALQTYARFSNQRAKVTEVVATDNSSIAVWAVQPGQEVAAHLHPSGQDTWVMLKGTLTYYLGNGQRQIISAGECAIADRDQIHGAMNDGIEDAVFVSIYSDTKIGYTKASP